MALTKKDANAKYDKLRKQLKAGDITKERFKQAADRIYKMYHSDANKATRNAKPAIKAKMPGGSTRAEVEKSFNKAKAINNFVGPGGSRTREDLKRSESEYNKSKPKKPSRSSFPAGRAGASKYAAALRKYNSTNPKPRRSRLTTAQRRRARRGGRG
jgi:hypothetical protein|tara:strand:- start:700 stop:1170 length:471 start_codon:yes stop_codon:yes gene_type:complete